MSEPAHAIYAPSSAFRWIPCTASAEGVAALPSHLTESGEEAEQGTAAHEEIERILGHLNSVPVVGGGDFIAHVEILNHDHPAAYGIALVVDFARQLAVATPGRFWIEQRVRLTDKIWGRCDVAHWHEESATLTIVDYKNGFLDVQAVENEQLRIYAAGSIFTHNLPAKWIRYVVVQPNSFMPVERVKQWVESAADLYAFAERTAKIPDGPKSFAFGEHCRDCPLFGMCPPTKDILLHLGAMMAKPAAEVPADKIAIYTATRKPIEHFFDALWKHGTKLALAGNVPPDTKLVTSQKHRAWKDPAAARAAVLAQLGTDGLDPPTPAQAVERGLPEATVDTLSARPPGGPALALTSDKRAPWVPKSAATMFAGVTGGVK